MEVGLGQLGLSPREFWDMTPLEFLCAQKGFFELYRVKEKSDWHRTIELINIQLPKKNRINPDEVLKDKPKGAKGPKKSLEEMKALAEKLKSIKNWKPYNGISR